jgi:Domain of unknown function (DUF4276)
MVIQPLVEGYGEVEAVPLLLRRLQETAGHYGFRVAKPFRRNRSELTTEASVRSSVKLALGREDCGGVLIVFDSDDDPACTIGPNVKMWAQSEAGLIPCEVVAVTREYEAWFISAIESLRENHGISPLATSHNSPETVRDAKGVLQSWMLPPYYYSPRVDQASLTAGLDLRQVHRRCRSFKRIVKAFGILAQATQTPLENWPPPDW